MILKSLVRSSGNAIKVWESCSWTRSEATRSRYLPTHPLSQLNAMSIQPCRHSPPPPAARRLPPPPRTPQWFLTLHSDRNAFASNYITRSYFLRFVTHLILKQIADWVAFPPLKLIQSAKNITFWSVGLASKVIREVLFLNQNFYLSSMVHSKVTMFVCRLVLIL